MSIDIEEIVGRELREVADGLHVPAMPVLPQEPPRAPRHWQLLVAAAVVVLIVACAIAVEAISGGSHELDPAPPRPTPGHTESQVRISRDAPTTPYVLGQKLYVGGQQVPGDWWSVEYGADAWVALRADDTWWRGRGSEAFEIEGLSGVPVISPNGRYVAAVDDRRGVITGFETADGGEGFGEVPVDLGNPAVTGDPVHVRAVTDDGRVVAQGAAASVLWRPLVDGTVVDLTKGEPDSWVVGNTPAGLVVTDGVDGSPYLAEISDAGELTRTGDLPENDSVVVSPRAERLVWTPSGTLGGEVTVLSSLESQRLEGTDRVTFRAPTGWGFRVHAWAWEDDQHLVSPVVSDDPSIGDRLVRCSAAAGRCVLIESPPR